MKTTNLKALMSSSVWSKLDPNFSKTIVEEIPLFPDWIDAQSPLPSCKINIEKNCIVFDVPIKITDIHQIYNSRKGTWAYLANRPPGDMYRNATMLSDGMTLSFGSSKNLEGFLITDKLAGFVNKTYTVKDFVGNKPNLPKEWTRPTFILDLSQLNDATTYDGSFAISECEARSIINLPPNILWGYVSDLAATPMSILPTVTPTVSRADVQSAINQVHGVLTTLQNILNSIK